METLKQKTARGLFWGGMNTMVQQVIGLLFGIILGRLLAPSDYGMMAIISVFSLVAVALQDSGFKVALANEKAPTHADYNAVFWFNILMGIALYAARQLAAFRKLMRFTAFVSFPLLFGFGIVAHEFIVIALTEKWEASAVLIQILCVAGAVSPVSALLGNAIVSSGRSGTFFRATLVVGLANIVLMCVLWPWGIHVMVVAYVLLAVAAMLLWHALAAPLLRYRLALFLKDILPFALLPPHQHAPAAGAAPSGASSTPSSSHGTARSLTWSRGEISI